MFIHPNEVNKRVETDNVALFPCSLRGFVEMGERACANGRDGNVLGDNGKVGVRLKFEKGGTRESKEERA